MKQLNIGVIGCGAIAQAVHLSLLRKMSDVRVAAVAEPDERRRLQACALFADATSYDHWQQLLAGADVEAVIISAPTGMHSEIAIAALNAGKHVYLEKPLAICVKEGQRVVDVWQKSGRVGMIGFNYRFNPLYAHLKEQVVAKRVGEVVCVRTVFSTHASAMPEWKKSRSSGGGVLLDLSSHHIDLMRFYFGEVETVRGEITSLTTEADTAVLSMKMRDGPPIESFFSLASVEEDRIEVYGRNGKLWVDRYRSPVVQYETSTRGMDAPKRLLAAMKSGPAVIQRIMRRGSEPSYAAALSRFVDACNGIGVSHPGFRDGLKSLEVIEAAEQSAAQRRTIELESSRTSSEA